MQLRLQKKLLAVKSHRESVHEFLFETYIVFPLNICDENQTGDSLKWIFLDGWIHKKRGRGVNVPIIAIYAFPTFPCSEKPQLVTDISRGSDRPSKIYGFRVKYQHKWMFEFCSIVNNTMKRHFETFTCHSLGLLDFPISPEWYDETVFSEYE